MAINSLSSAFRVGGRIIKSWSVLCWYEKEKVKKKKGTKEKKEMVKMGLEEGGYERNRAEVGGGIHINSKSNNL